MTVLTPLETTGTSTGMPIEVPQCIRMIAFIDLKVLVITGEVDVVNVRVPALYQLVPSR